MVTIISLYTKITERSKVTLKQALSSKGVNVVFATLFVILILRHVSASTPAPGHPWAAAGDGLWGATGTLQYHTFSFPNSDADVLTDYNVTQGDFFYGTAASTTGILPKNANATRYVTNRGTLNNPMWSTVSLSDGVDGILPIASGGTGIASTSFTGMTLARTYTLPDSNATLLTDFVDVTLAQGGTGLTMAASNGSIIYSSSTVLDILAATSTAQRLLMSQSGQKPKWSFATYPTTVAASGSLLISNGTNVTTQLQSAVSVTTKSFGTTGAFVASTTNSLTAFRVGMFNIPELINVNTLSISPTTVTTPGTVKICIYDEAGNKLIDTTATGAVSNTTLSTTTPATVQLHPGNYYMAIGCATTCNILFNYWRSTVGSPMTTLPPAGKKVYEGLVTMTSGTCNATLPAITAAASSTPVGRLDN